MLQAEHKSFVQDPFSGVKGQAAELHHRFYRCMGKRVLDIVVAGPALLLLAPLFSIVAIVTKLSSPGPVFFCQRRVGKDEKTFVILKFRSMVSSPGQGGAQITASNDPRITPWGAFLRRHKIDELPQLWNVLKGDMSLVGPRPEVEFYTQFYTPMQKQVLKVRPGITDAGSLLYRQEEKLLATSSDPRSFYVEQILPKKLALNLQYMKGCTFFQDLVLIARTVRTVFE
jgi:lipopolysaccharide/colanic/teichoic acid biosynthesis glycosyltransferase